MTQARRREVLPAADHSGLRHDADPPRRPLRRRRRRDRADRSAGGQEIDFDSLVHLAQTAERAKFDFCVLAEGLRMREHAGRLHDLDGAVRPDSFTA